MVAKDHKKKYGDAYAYKGQIGLLSLWSVVIDGSTFCIFHWE
jgi:hypothetical protein